MFNISTLCTFVGWAAVAGVFLLGRLDYRNLRRRGDDWDCR